MYLRFKNFSLFYLTKTIILIKYLFSLNNSQLLLATSKTACKGDLLMLNCLAVIDLALLFCCII